MVSALATRFGSSTRVLVVGGTRFVGPPIIERLLQDQCHVTVLNRGTNPACLPPEVDRIICDRTDHAALAAALQGQQYQVVVDIVAYKLEDTKGLLAALDCSELGHLIHISTCGVYMPSHVYPIKEHFPRGLHDYPYGDRKFEIEELLFRAHREDGLPVTIIRPGAIFGPGNHVYREAFYLDRLLAGRPLLCPGDGTILTQFGYIDDHAQLVMAALGDKRSIGEAYNFAGEYAMTTKHYLSTVIDVLGERFGSERQPGSRIWEAPEIIYFDPAALGMPPEGVGKVFPYKWQAHVHRDTSKAQIQLGYRESVDLREGLRRYFDWYLQGGGRAASAFPVPSFSLEDEIIASLGR